MSRKQASRVSVPPSFFPKLMLPFFLPAILTFVLMFTVGESWPRNIAPGSGLKLWGFGATAVTALLAWRYAIRGIADPRAHKMAAAVEVQVILLTLMIEQVIHQQEPMGVLAVVAATMVMEEQVGH